MGDDIAFAPANPSDPALLNTLEESRSSGMCATISEHLWESAVREAEAVGYVAMSIGQENAKGRSILPFPSRCGVWRVFDGS